jgi:hypothetical protein
VTPAHPGERDDPHRQVITTPEEGDMQAATVTEISWNAYMEARKASHLEQVRRVRESLLRRGDAGEERPKRR